MLVQTVLGPIEPGALGVTLPHEHFFIATVNANFDRSDDPELKRLAEHPVDLEIRGWLEQHWHRNLDNLCLDEEDVAVAEGVRYRDAGGRSIIDVTPIGIGRNPTGLRRVAEGTGLHIVMGCGYYHEAAHPDHVATMTPEEVANEIVDEFAHGVGDTGVRPGVIGEIGCSWPLTRAEEQVLRGAGLAQRALGAALYVHPGRDPRAPEQILTILDDTGADIARVVMCHVERTVPSSGLSDLAASGCFIEFDLFGMEVTGSYFKNLGITLPSDGQRLDSVAELIDGGYGEQVLISHDMCFKHRLSRYGGHGYDHIVANIVPWMRLRGFDEAAIEMLIVENPRRVATFAPPVLAGDAA
jgi:phosphotriesterase-related protein